MQNEVSSPIHKHLNKYNFYIYKVLSIETNKIITVGTNKIVSMFRVGQLKVLL